MIKNHIIVLSWSFFVFTVQGMELESVSSRDCFSDQPNHVKKRFIFPLVNECTDIKQVRDVLLSIGLVSKKSYGQIKCPFFIRHVVKILASQYKLQDAGIATRLNMVSSKHYREKGETLFSLIIKSEEPDKKSLSRMRKLIEQGTDVNFHSALFGITPLMKSVFINSPQLVNFLLARGANQDDYNAERKYVRNFNLIYDEEKLRRVIVPINNLMLQIEAHNATNEEKKFSFKSIYKLPEASTIRKALYIDRVLEDKKSVTTILDSCHPFIKRLKKSAITRRALIYVFDNNREYTELCLPSNIRQYLDDISF